VANSGRNEKPAEHSGRGRLPAMFSPVTFCPLMGLVYETGRPLPGPIGGAMKTAYSSGE
jgi:hypothetical protein